MNLIPAKTFTPEYFEDICKENIFGVVISVYIRGDFGKKTPAWRGKNVDLFHKATYGYFGVNSANERFTSNAFVL